MKLLLTGVMAAVAVVALGFGTLAPTQKAEAAKPPTSVVLPVTGAIANGGGSFAGTLDVNKIVSQNGQLTAVGTLSGTLTDSVGNLIGTVTNVPVSIPVTQAAGSCEILNLVLGPLDLNLLGLVVHLDTVHLNITAQQGSGNLLGNLLCAVAGLLDNQNSTSGLAHLLNRILSILG